MKTISSVLHYEIHFLKYQLSPRETVKEGTGEEMSETQKKGGMKE